MTTSQHASSAAAPQADLPFASDAPRLHHFRNRLREQLHDSAFRQMAGFPNGTDDSILALFDTPAFTPCPNPFIQELLNDTPALTQHTPDTGSHSKKTQATALTYHTKVPIPIIETLLESYCPPNGIVLDCFGGSGTTAIAVRRTGRRAVLVDLAPGATTIAACYGVPVDRAELQAAGEQFIKTFKQKGAKLYARGAEVIEYVLWSDVCQCPHCQHSFPLAEATSNPKSGFSCPACRESISPKKLKRCFDDAGKNLEQPVSVKYQGRKKKVALSPADQALVSSLVDTEAPSDFLQNRMMNVASDASAKRWGDMYRAGYHSGVERASDFFYPRTLWGLKLALEIVERQPMSAAVRRVLRTAIINAAPQLSRMRRASQGVLPLLLYIPRVRREVNVITALETKVKKLIAELNQLPPTSGVVISTQSSTHLPQLPDNSIDYVFIDPPFGNNIIYSEVNFLWESLLGVFTAQAPEAIVSRAQNKGVGEYQHLMTACLQELYRVLKPGRWLTLVFHNSDKQVWGALQEALRSAGFVLTETRVLDKKRYSFKQVSTENAVKHDLMLFCQKPLIAGASAELKTGTVKQVWEIVRERLHHLPVLTTTSGQLARDVERQKYLLFDHAVAQHLKQQITFPLSAHEFYAGLDQRFAKQGESYFLPEQLADQEPSA